MPPENTKKYSPPYISPRSFYHLIERLQENIPGRIDRSYLDTMFSGSASTQIMAAMRFMNLIDTGNKPTHHLRLLVDSREEERTKRLKDLCNSAYGIVFTNGSVARKPPLMPSWKNYSSIIMGWTEMCAVNV
jgi:hypothetical protein